MSSSQQIPQKIAPAGSKSPSAAATSTSSDSAKSNDAASNSPAPARMLVPAFLFPNADGSTAVAQLVSSTSTNTQNIQNIIINSIMSKPTPGGSNNLLGVLTPVVNSGQGPVKVIGTAAPAGAKISITPTVAPITKVTTTTTSTNVITFPANVGENQLGVGRAPLLGSQININELLAQAKLLPSGQQFKKIQPVGGIEITDAAGKAYPKLIKSKKPIDIKLKGNTSQSTPTLQLGEGGIVPIMNEFPNLITIHGLTSDKKDEETPTPQEEQSEGISYSDLLCTEEMGKRSDDGRDSNSKSPEPIPDETIDVRREDHDVNQELENPSDIGTQDKKDEEEKAKTCKPPVRCYKRPSILGTRKRTLPEPSNQTQAMLKETLREELRKLNDEEEKQEVKKKKKVPKEKSNKAAKIVPKIDQSLIRPAIEDFDPANLLDWRDGVGVLPGSNLKFRVNELGLMELVEESEESDGEMDLDVNDLFKKCENIQVINTAKSESEGDSVPKKRSRKDKISSYDTCCCEQCGCYGLAKEYVKQRFCSTTCEDKFEKRLKKKHEQDVLEQLEKKRLQSAEKSVSLEKLDTSKWLFTSIGSEEGTSEAPLPAPDSPDPEGLSVADADSTPADSKPNSEGNSPEPSTSITPVSEHDDEDSKNADGYPNDMPWINFNTDRTPNFLWPKYLEFTKTRAAPSKLFEEGGFPERPNGFRPGMKLEGIDPRMPSQFVVMSVVSIKGFRVKLHIDGASDTQDFWVNADCRDIFPAGHCEKIAKKLVPPKAFAKKFTWAHYVKLTNTALAPRGLFIHRQTSKNTVGPSGFRVGMKLEAIDRSNHELVCVATVNDIFGGRVLIHFDSWDDTYDYWADPTSPFIHPVGYCEASGLELIPPKGIKDFNWDDYLRDTKSQAVPTRAFKPKLCPGFKRGMKLECVDPRFPQLIRVGSILEVKNHRLHVGFDNWPLETSTWMDADSPDIHPMGWCNKTGHPLGPPPVPGVEYQCYTPHCRALLKNSQFILPHMSSCPLSNASLSKARIAKLKDTKSKQNDVEKEEEKQEEPEEEENGAVEEEDELYVPQVKRKKKSQEVIVRPVGSSYRSDVHDSVFRPGYSPSVKNMPVTKATHARLVNWSNVEDKFDISVEGIKKWSPDEVSSFAQQVIGVQDKIQKFVDENINGNAFLMLSQSDLVELLGFKIGQAVKIYNSIILLKDGK